MTLRLFLTILISGGRSDAQNGASETHAGHVWCQAAQIRYRLQRNIRSNAARRQDSRDSSCHMRACGAHVARFAGASKPGHQNRGHKALKGRRDAGVAVLNQGRHVGVLLLEKVAEGLDFNGTLQLFALKRSRPIDLSI